MFGSWHAPGELSGRAENKIGISPAPRSIDRIHRLLAALELCPEPHPVGGFQCEVAPVTSSQLFGCSLS